MRCGNELIDEGELQADVLRKCGQPATRQISEPQRDEYGNIVQGAATVENWIYGPYSGMLHYLRFVDGSLVQIQSKMD